MFWAMKVCKFGCNVAEGPRRGKPVKSRNSNFSRKNGALLLGFPGCGKKEVTDGGSVRSKRCLV